MDFSFIIPVYNCKEYLPACVESILAAKVPSCEILLVDDGSTDGSGVICDAFARQYPNIEVLHQKNAGASAARNAGMHAAHGEHILFIDSDDTLDSKELHTILTHPRCKQADLIIYGIRFDYYHHGKCYRSETLCYPYDGVLHDAEWPLIISNLFEKNALSSSCTKVYKRSILVENALELNTDMFLYEDLEFVLRYLSCCGDIWNVPKAIYHYRQTEDEGNAGRRLARIPSIPEFLIPIDSALENLRTSHPGVTEEACCRILQALHQVLAREKIAVSGLSDIRRICREYALWERKRIPNPVPSKFRDQLCGEKVAVLWLNHKKSKIRHRIAVIIKSALSNHRKGTHLHAAD